MINHDFIYTQFDKYSIILVIRIIYDIIIQDNNNDYGINKHCNNKVNDKIMRIKAVWIWLLEIRISL